MSQDLDNLIEHSILRDEVQHLKAYAIRLERENAALMDRLSHRRPSTAAIRRASWFRQRLDALMPFGFKAGGRLNCLSGLAALHYDRVIQTNSTTATLGSRGYSSIRGVVVV